jgi:hypothetical protein
MSISGDVCHCWAGESLKTIFHVQITIKASSSFQDFRTDWHPLSGTMGSLSIKFGGVLHRSNESRYLGLQVTATNNGTIERITVYLRPQTGDSYKAFTAIVTPDEQVIQDWRKGSFSGESHYSHNKEFSS